MSELFFIIFANICEVNNFYRKVKLFFIRNSFFNSKLFVPFQLWFQFFVAETRSMTKKMDDMVRVCPMNRLKPILYPDLGLPLPRSKYEIMY